MNNTKYSFTPKGTGYKIYATKRGSNTRARSAPKSKASLGILWVPIILLFIIGNIIYFIVENIVAILILLGVVLCVVIAYALYVTIEENNEKKKEYRSIIDNEPSYPIPMEIPEVGMHLDEFQKDLLLQFAEHIQCENGCAHAESRYKYLIAKENALKALKRNEEADATSDEVNASYQCLLKCREDLSKTKYHEPGASCAFSTPSDNLRNLKSFFSTVGDNVVTRFFNSDTLYLKSDNGDCFLAFFSHSAILCSANKIISFCQYNDISLASIDYIEMLDGGPSYDDEITSIHWMYETKNGRRDMRYKDNSQLFFAYRNKTVISYEEFISTIIFKSRIIARMFKRLFDAEEL